MSNLLFVGLYDAVYEPTDDPNYWRAVNVCDDSCHHPIHAFNKERKQHLEDAEWITKNGVPVTE